MNVLRKYIRRIILKQKDSKLNIAVSGDVMFGRYVGKVYHPINIREPFTDVKNIFRSSDLSIINLETPLFDKAPTWWHQYNIEDSMEEILVAPTSAAKILSNAGINMVSLANNHADDAGFDGFDSTHSALDNTGIIYSGTSTTSDPFSPTIFRVKNRNVIFFSTTFLRNFGNGWGDASEYPTPVAHVDNVQRFAKFLNMISFYREMYPNSTIIAAMHWGKQYENKTEVWQEVFAQEIVHAGANLILGHHPHVLRKFEYYKGALIFYSLGNLLFDHNYDVEGHSSVKNAASNRGSIFTFSIEQNNYIHSLKAHPTLSTPAGVKLAGMQS